MEPFAAGIMLVGFGVMLGIIRLQVAFTVIGLVLLAVLFWPYAGVFSKAMPTWVFWIVVFIIGINLLKGIMSALFGSNVADGFTGNLLSAIFTPVFNIMGAEQVKIHMRH